MASTAAVLNILVTANTAQAQAALAKTEAQLQSTNAQAATTGKGVGKFGAAAKTGAIAAAAGVAILAAEAYKLGKNFDDAYDTIQKQTGKTGRPLKRLEADFRSVLTKVPAGFQDVAEAIGTLNTRLGLSGKPLRRLSQQFLELSEVTGTDLSANLQNVTRAFKDWEVPVKEQHKILDGFYRLSTKTGISVTDLAESVVQFGAPLRNFGFTIQQAAGMFAEFEQAGVNMTTVMSGMRLATGNLAKPTSDLTKLLKDLGLAGADPQKQFLGITKAIDQAKTRQDALSIAIQVFGKRAANDMVEGVKQGRFQLDGLVKTMEHGKTTIHGTAADTRDAGENFAILGHKLAVLVSGPVTALYNGIGDLAGILARFNFQKFLHKDLGLTRGDLMAVGKVLKVVGQIFGAVLGRTIAAAVKGAIQTVRGFVQMIRGAVKLIGDLLHGRFSKAWQDVKQIFSGGVRAVVGVMKQATAPIVGAAKAIDNALGGFFSRLWKKIVGIFRDGANAVLSIVQAIADVINVIPGVPDINVPSLGGGGGQAKTGHRGKGGWDFQFATGGSVTKPMAIVGEEAPRHPEWVIATNPAYKKANLQYWAAAGRDLGVPGFGLGGALSGAAGAVGGAASSVGGKALGLGADLLGKGAGFFLDKLPNPADYLPTWIAGLGNYLVGKVGDWIKGGFSSGNLGGSPASGSTSFTGPPPSFQQLANNAWVDAHTTRVAGWVANKFGMALTSGYRSPAYNASIGGAQGSYHTHGTPANPGAWDISYGGATQAGLEGVRSYMARHVAGIAEGPLIDNVAGWNMHTGFFRKGGRLARFAGGGAIDWRKIFGTKFDANELTTLAKWAGMDHPALMAQHAMGESSGNPFAVGDGGDSIGLWQIDTAFHPQYSKAWLRNPLNNAKAAALIEKSEGIGAFHAPPTGAKGRVVPSILAALHGGGVSGGGGGGGGGGTKVTTGVHPHYPVGLDFPPLPETIKGCTAELRERRLQLRQTEDAAAHATGDERKRIDAVVARIKKRIKALIAQRNRLILRHHRKINKAIGRVGQMLRQQGVIGNFDSRIEILDERIRKALALEPESVSQGYVDNVEAPLYNAVIGQMFGERNYLTGAIWSGRYQADNLTAQIRRTQKNPKQRWRVPAMKAARSNILGTLIPDWTQRLTDLQGPGGSSTWIFGLPPLGVLGGSIFDRQLEQRDLGLKVDTSDSQAASDAQIGRLAEMLRLANLRTAVSQAQSATIAGLPPFGGFFQEGGRVPGPIGAPTTIIAHGGETVNPVGAAPVVEVNIGNGMEWLNRFIEVKVDGVTRKAASKLRTPGQPGRLRRG